jgi:hypothetical protein
MLTQWKPLAFLLLVTMQRNNTGVLSVSMVLFGYLATTRVLHSNDGLRSNKSLYVISVKLFPLEPWPGLGTR